MFATVCVQPMSVHEWQILKEEGAKCNAGLLMIPPENSEDLRDDVNIFGDIEMGVLT